MMFLRFRASLAVVGLLVAGSLGAPAIAQDAATEDAVRKNAQQLVTAFNAGKSDEVASMFLPQGELIDEAGTVYQGPQEIKGILNAFFKTFPGAKLTINVESIRPVGPVVIDEGTRVMSASDGTEQAHFRYIAVWAKSNNDWKLASFRDFADDPPPTAGDFLNPLSWLVGEWVNEGADGKVAITYRWSDDKNFLLGDFEVRQLDGTMRKSMQRLGYDPSTGNIRSWLFDSDGGFAEGTWTIVDDGVVAKANSVNPDGSTASATLNITRTDDDHYTIAGTERIVAGALEPDFEITVTRRPPAAKD